MGENLIISRLSTALVLLVLGAPMPVSAERLIPFQGRLTDGQGTPLEGVFRVTFAIYDEPTGGTPLNSWVETHDDVSIIAGQINVLLGSIASLDDPDGNGSMDDAITFDGDTMPRYLGIKVGEDGNQEMVPRHQLVPSFHARLADTTVDGGVNTDQLADRAVTIEKIDPGVIQSIIPPGSILPYVGSEAPEGWVMCDGAEFDGTDPRFEPLFEAIGNTFGGTAPLFNVPDLRGRFLRGVDAGAGVDPDAAERTGGDAVGSTQGSAIVDLSGNVAAQSVPTTVNGEHIHRENPNFNPDDTPGTPTALAGDLTTRFTTTPFFTDPAGDHQHTVNIPASSVTVGPTAGAAFTSTEVRPANVAVNYICKL